MKKERPGILIVAFLTLWIVLCQETGAQAPTPYNQGWGPDEPYGMLYDPTTQMVVAGRIVRIEEAIPGRGAAPAIYIDVRTDEGLVVPVLLGPQWYILSRHVLLNLGGVVQVAGSRVAMSQTVVIIASWVQSGDRVLVLRDDFGYPVWEWW